MIFFMTNIFQRLAWESFVCQLFNGAISYTNYAICTSLYLTIRAERNLFKQPDYVTLTLFLLQQIGKINFCSKNLPQFLFFNYCVVFNISV